MRQGRPTTLHILLISLPKAPRGGDLTVMPLTSFLITNGVQGTEDIGAELIKFVENGVDDFSVDIPVAGKVLVMPVVAK